MSPKTVGWMLFASLGLNILLGGVLLGRGMRPRAPLVGPHGEAATVTEPMTPPKGPFDARKSHFDARQERPEERRFDRGPKEHRPEDGPGNKRHAESNGPPTLMLLRGIARVMGGRDDPRVKAVLFEERGQFRKDRAEIAAAHQRVHDALLAEPFQEEELRQAFSALAERTGHAQTEAQERVVLLAKQLTKEERKRLARQFSRKDHRPPRAN